MKKTLATSTDAVMYPGYFSGKFPARRIPRPSFHTVAAVYTQNTSRTRRNRTPNPAFAARSSAGNRSATSG